MPRCILLLNTPDDNLKGLARTFSAAAGADEVEVETFSTSNSLLKRLDSGLKCDLVVLDYFLGDGRQKGRDVLRAVREASPLVPVVAVAETGNVETAAKAIQAGATDFLVRSGRLKKRVSTLLGKIWHLLDIIDENRVLGEQNMLLREADRSRYRMMGESPQIDDIIRQIERIGVIPRPVLILGERGTGKELVARAIHEAAGAESRPFVAVNCAAFSDALLESELFGHERGAFTGAESQTHGKFEQANNGTLFLDEIGNMSLPFQRKILRVVEYGMFTRVGGKAEIKTNARIIAATNADLQVKMRQQEFLRDLYDRLAFEVIDVPPLRAREGDIERLARHFLAEFMREIPALGGKRLAQNALKALRTYRFPGNVRELKNIIERAAYRDTTNEITADDIGLLPNEEITLSSTNMNFGERVEYYQQRMILNALQEARGNQAQAARDLGLSYHQYRYYYKKYVAANVKA